MDREQMIEQAVEFWASDDRRLVSSGLNRWAAEIAADFAVEVGKEQAATIERLTAALKECHLKELCFNATFTKSQIIHQALGYKNAIRYIAKAVLGGEAMTDSIRPTPPAVRTGAK